MTYEDWLREQLKGAPHGTKKALAEHMGIDGPKLSKTLAGGRELSARELQKAVDFFGAGPDALRSEDRMVPIVGYAGAGPDGSVLFADGQGNYGEATAPIDASDSTEALEVRGDSMHGLANDGWLIFYDEKTVPGPEHMGEPCVCWLANGKVLVKTPQPGSERGLFHLESVNARTLRDQVVEAMAVITDIKTRAAAKKYIRRHPNVPVEDLVIDRKAG